MRVGYVSDKQLDGKQHVQKVTEPEFTGLNLKFCGCQ